MTEGQTHDSSADSQGRAQEAHSPDWPLLSLETSEPTNLSRGWVSGLISAILGLSAMGAVICFHVPGLTVQQVRSHYPVELIRWLLHVFMVASFFLGVTSLCLRRNKLLGLIGICSTLIAALLGGATVEIGGDVWNTWLGLDWFVINLILYSAVYIPLERFFSLRPEQPTFRREWPTDLSYFFVNSLLVQILGILTVQPAMVLFHGVRSEMLVSFLSSLPVLIQAVLCIFAADLTQYWVHRAFHQIPMLWRFHAVHHSTESMDWLAGSRLHLIDAAVTRSLTYVPLYLLGFSEAAIAVYVVVVVVQATFIHANVRWQFRGLQKWVATPMFHHWHHAAEPEAIDVNFSVHTPIWDTLFGTCYLPGRWPHSYGLCGKRDVPAGWLQQFFYPFVWLWRNRK